MVKDWKDSHFVKFLELDSVRQKRHCLYKLWYAINVNLSSLRKVGTLNIRWKQLIKGTSAMSKVYFVKNDVPNVM